MLATQGKETPPPSIVAAWMCCDGRGGFKVCYNPELYDAIKSTTYGECVDVHERDHVSYFRKNSPDSCKDRKSGESLFKLTRKQVAEIECRAYKRQINCLLLNAMFFEAQELRDIADYFFSCGFNKPKK